MTASSPARTRRRPHWRPLCPECGYDIFRSTEPRCAECGAAFPTPSRAYRRWAIPRLPWDCLRRAGLVRDYLVTLWRVVVCPCSAARRLVIPDRFGRASRWAAGHLLVALGLLMGVRFLNTLIWLGLYVTGTADERDSMNADRAGEPLLTLNEFGWPLLANAIALAVIPAIGAGLAWLIPMRHPAARAAGIKWSLYAAAVPLVVVLASAAGYVAMLPMYAQVIGGSLHREAPWPHRPVLAASFIAYGLSWSIGMNAHPYQRRGWRWFVGYATAFTAACLLLYYVILPPWVLVTLL